ncbi:MAG: hypothetical protein ACJAQT_005031, partial [Akkermansiaceae bacterium]
MVKFWFSGGIVREFSLSQSWKAEGVKVAKVLPKAT